MRRIPVRLAALIAAGVLVAVAGTFAADPPKAAPPNAEARADKLIRLNNLGAAHLARFREQDAIQAFQAALALDPDYAPAHTNLGIAYLSLADYPKAEAELRRGLALAPGEPHALFNLGLALKIQGRTEDAIAKFEEVRRIDPDDPDTIYQLGSLYARQNRLPEAIAAFRRALELGPDNVSAYYGLGKALLQSGETEEGRELLERSQAMKEYGRTVGTRYGEQGRYSYAVDDESARALARSPALPPIPVRFVPAAGPALPAPAAGKGCEEGPGAAVGDIDGDGDLDLYLPACGGGRLLRNDGGLRFADATGEAGLADGYPGIAAAFGDFDNDHHVDLFVSGPQGGRLYHQGEAGRFADVTVAAGIRIDGKAAGASWADVDHDGDLDLYVVRRDAGPPNRLLLNRGDGTFEEAAARMHLEGIEGAAPSLLFADLDDDRDIDLVLPGRAGPWQWMSNDRVGTFTDVAPDGGLAGGPANGVAAGDYDKDGDLDLAASGPEGWHLLRNGSGGSFEAVAGVPEAAGPVYGVTFLDYDNDSLLDLALARGGAEGPAVMLLRNVGQGRFVDRTGPAGLASLTAREGRSLVAADLDGDGDLDLLLTQRAGAPTLLRNDGGDRNHSLVVDPVGKGSNRSGIGVKVEMRAGRMWQKMEVTSASGYLSSGPSRVHFGLGDQATADTVRLLWPSGVLQDEIDPPSVVTVEELDRKGSSCPILYAWDGTAFAFVTDFLGGSAIGYRVGASSFNHPDTDEYVKLRRDQLVPRRGRLSLRMVNQLEEVIFFDRASLLAVDHPADRTVYPNERLLPGPPFPEFELFVAAEERPPRAAVDDRGDDVLPEVLHADRRWPDRFGILPFKGYAEEHTLVLDPGDLSGARRVVLLADAWIDYADSTSNLAASQAGLVLRPPSLEVVAEDGTWVEALPQMGFPAGLPKTLAVELTGLFRRQDDFRVRITTNMRIYFDRVRFAILDDATQPRVHRLEATSADLRFRGYPRAVSPDGRAPFAYDYDDAATEAGWKEFGGAFTAHGDVRGLLREVDDRYVIARHGDEIALEFDARELPRLPDGWTRTWLVYADGFGKDMDLNSAAPDRVEPLPFHGMAAYPAPAEEQNAVDASRLEWILRNNTRFP